MDTFQLISTAREHAGQAHEQGVRSIRLPVLGFSDWAGFFERPDDLAAREAHRTLQKRNYYFKHFLENHGIEVTMVLCTVADLMQWAMDHEHPLLGERERAHVLIHFINQPDLPPTKCVHKRPLTADLAGSSLELFASITMYGDNPEQPELMSTVIHTRDGLVVDSLEALSVEHDPQEAFGLASELMARHGVGNAFHDPQVREPRFCPDCNELLLNVAGSREYKQLDRSVN